MVGELDLEVTADQDLNTQRRREFARSRSDSHRGSRLAVARRIMPLNSTASTGCRDDFSSLFLS
jgi:hypothetical protein